ncbi:hypothetical protein ID866_11177 [Astraeus odoratus]|nr:hypothetical protein ID866_11177 [Astraeus odoratus]
MSSPCRTSSPHERCLAKTKAPKERMEEEWRLVSKGELDPVSSDDKKTAEMRDQEKKQRVEVWKEKRRWRQDEVEKRAREEAKCLARKEAARKAQEEAERKVEEEHKEAVAREEAARRAAEAIEERADTKRRALEKRLWEAAGQRLETAVVPPWVAKPSGRMTMMGPSAPGWRTSGVQDPCTRCRNKGTSCVLGVAKGKTSACKACQHAKVSCSWAKKMAGETHKRKQVQHSEETEGREVIDVDADDDEDEEQSHFAVPTHLAEEHRDALGALTMTLDMLSMDLLKFQRDSWNLGVAMLRAIETITNELRRANDLKEEEMGRSKGKGKEKEEGPRGRRTEDEDGDTEMGGAGPSSLA